MCLAKCIMLNRFATIRHITAQMFGKKILSICEVYFIEVVAILGIIKSIFIGPTQFITYLVGRSYDLFSYTNHAFDHYRCASLNYCKRGSFSLIV